MLRETLADEALVEIEGMLTTLGRLFAEAGYAPVQPPHLFAAEAMLDLYGEDIRARAFLFPDQGLGPAYSDELCLRPDFTVPVAQAHGKAGWSRAARYTYQGPVFRRQDAAKRPTEYLQAGIEDFGAEDRAGADTRVFTLLSRALDALSAPASVTTIGDLGIPFRLLDALDMAPFRRAELRRHFWRPRRFQAALDRFTAPAAARSEMRLALMAAVESGEVEEMALAAGEEVGLRSLADITARARHLAETAGEPPMPKEQAALIGELLAIKGQPAAALARLRDLASAGGVDLSAALDLFEARLEALAKAGTDTGALRFDAAFGRNLEYYDGFVFEIVAEGMEGAPPMAGGGRYDAITRRLGADSAVPAVGGIVRPEAVRAAIRGTV